MQSGHTCARAHAPVHSQGFNKHRRAKAQHWHTSTEGKDLTPVTHPHSLTCEASLARRATRSRGSRWGCWFYRNDWCGQDPRPWVCRGPLHLLRPRPLHHSRVDLESLGHSHRGPAGPEPGGAWPLWGWGGRFPGLQQLGGGESRVLGAGGGEVPGGPKSASTREMSITYGGSTECHYHWGHWPRGTGGCSAAPPLLGGQL